jgi:O-antigen ligase
VASVTLHDGGRAGRRSVVTRTSTLRATVGALTVRAAITQRLPTVGWAAVLVAFAGVPIVFHRATVDIFNIVKVTLLWLAVLVAFACWLGWSASRRRWTPAPWVAIPVAAFVALTALATALSVSPGVSFLGQYRRYDGLASTLAYAAIAWLVVAYCWERPARLRQLAVAGLLGAGLAAAYLLLQEIGIDRWEWIDPSGRELRAPQGPIGNSNFAGAYLAMSVPLALGLRALTDDRRWRYGLVALCVPLVAGVWVAQSRGGFLALACGVAVAGLLDRRVVPRLVTVGASLATIAGLVLIGVFAVTGSAPGVSSDRSVTGSETLESRIQFWEGAVGVIADHPVIGTGPDTFLVAFPPHRPVANGGSDELAADEPHNILLDHAAGRGIPALLAFLAAVVLTFRFAWRAREALDPVAGAFLAAFGGLFGAYLVQGLVSIDAPPLALGAWLSIGALATLSDPRVAAARTRLETAAAVGARRRPARERAVDRDVERVVALPTLALLALGAGVVVLGAVALRPVIADARYRDGLEASSAGSSSDRVVGALEAAVAWNPVEPAYEVRLAQQWQLLASADELDDERRAEYFGLAARHFDRALEQLPENPFTLREAARSRSAWAGFDPDQFDEAAALYERALAIDPHNWQLRDDFAILLESWARASDDVTRRDDAIEQLEISVDLRPENVGGWLRLAVLYEATGQVDDAEAALNEAVARDPDRPEVIELTEAFLGRNPTADIGG